MCLFVCLCELETQPLNCPSPKSDKMKICIFKKEEKKVNLIKSPAGCMHSLFQVQPKEKCNSHSSLFLCIFAFSLKRSRSLYHMLISIFLDANGISLRRRERHQPRPSSPSYSHSRSCILSTPVGESRALFDKKTIYIAHGIIHVSGIFRFLL